VVAKDGRKEEACGMVTISIGSSVPVNLEDAAESWITEQVNRRGAMAKRSASASSSGSPTST
jgi:hypothetical protein